MRLPRIRVSIRAMMVAVALLALFINLGMAVHDRYFVPTYPVVYIAGDLMDPSAPASTELLRVRSSLQAATTRQFWWTGKSRSVTPFLIGNRLIVRQSSYGHRQVENWFREERARRNLPPPRLDANVIVNVP